MCSHLFESVELERYMNKEITTYQSTVQKAPQQIFVDRDLLANTPLPGRIPAWWLLEGTPQQITEWQRQLDSGEAVLDE